MSLPMTCSEAGQRSFQAFERTFGKARGGDVIRQRIDPDIDDVPRRVRHRDAPVERRARDRQILQAALDEAHDLVAALRRQEEAGFSS